MTRKHAKETAAARGFRSVTHWMSENRKARAGFNSRLGCKGENRARLETLIRQLDSEHDQFRNLA